ncbi:MAG: 16S rRNA (guanine(966)-N(2))-methyltransferase RsmD [Acidimicrobiia bacterium]|nr:MAG: 16S rRNA (guanine(966)-N(2))-methyltransferase RsmD [Acidimicrobiia bacterium]
MRIIAGRSKGTRLAVPETGTRPMTGRARESVFSILRDRLFDAHVLDLYAGSGSLGLEALSRGATDAVFVEGDRTAVEKIHKNVVAVGLGGTVTHGTLPGVLSRLSGTFDLVFVDPPYSDPDADVLLTLAALDRVLASSGLVVVHRQASSDIVLPEFLTCKDQRRYGDAVLTMMERATS